MPDVPLDPTELDDRLVFGDLLMQRGDPLGELIAVHHALDSLPPDAPGAKRRILEHRVSRIFDEHHATLFGALAPHVQAPSGPSHQAPAVEIVWRGGFADTASIESPGDELDLADIYRELQRLPLARFLRRLEVGRGDYAGFMAALDADPSLALRELILHGQTEVLAQSTMLKKAHRRLNPTSWTAGCIDAVIDGALFARLPALDTLLIDGLADGLLEIEAPNLRDLSVKLVPDARDELARSTLPALESLTYFQTTITLELIERSPGLTRISCVAGGRVSELVRGLSRSPCLGRLRELRLMAGGLSDEDLAIVTSCSDRFAHLDVLDFSGHVFSRAVAAAARQRLPQLHVTDSILR